MNFFNLVLTSLFTLLMKPFTGLHPVAGITFISVLTGIIMLLVFKKTSNQAAIRKARDRMQGKMIEIRLFQNDPVAVLRAAGGVLTGNMVYLRYMFAPMLFLIVPVILLLIQAGAYYSLRPVLPGENVIVKMKLRNGADTTAMNSASLSAPEGVKIEAGPLRIPARGEINWRISSDKPGTYPLDFKTNGQSISKKFVVSEKLLPAWRARISSGFFARLSNPGEPASTKGIPVSEITISYPRRLLMLAGRDVNWILFFLVVSVLAGFALKPVFKVEF